MSDSNTQQPDSHFTEELSAAPLEEKAERIDTEKLKKEATKREKKQSLITRIIKAVRNEKKAYSELIIKSGPL